MSNPLNTLTIDLGECSNFSIFLQVFLINWILRYMFSRGEGTMFISAGVDNTRPHTLLLELTETLNLS